MDDKKGGPTAIIYGFEEAFSTVFKQPCKYDSYSKHALYIELYKLHSKNVGCNLNYSLEHPGMSEFGLPPLNFPPVIYKKDETKPENPPVLNPAPEALPKQDQSHDGQSKQPPSLNGDGLGSSSVKDGNLKIEPAQPAPAAPAPETTGPAPTTEKPVVPPVTKQEEESLQKKKLKKCDEVFAEYLDSVAKFVNKDCYKQVLKFIFLFRECLNHYGERLSKSKLGSGVQPIGYNGKTEENKEEEYCLVNNAEQAPEVSNEFVTLYLDEVKTNFGKLDVIELTQNFCCWLFNNGYTCSKLSLIQENAQ